MTFAIAIVGLAFLIFIHELGHFVVSLLLRMRPRRFYVGFPPAVLKKTHNGIEYGIGAIPLGGFVKIPGMHRPAPGDVDLALGRVLEEQPGLAGKTTRLRHALAAGDHPVALEALGLLREDVAALQLSPRARQTAERGLEDLADGLGPQAYWRAPTWKRVAAILAGPAANIVLALALFTGLYMSAGGAPTTTIRVVDETMPAFAMGLQAGDRIVSIDGAPATGDTIGELIRASEGQPVRLVVARAGRQLALPPTSPRLDDGAYRLGFALRSEPLGLVAASGRSVELVGDVTVQVGKTLGRLATGDARDEISSPVGIVQGSSDAARDGTESFLVVLGLISLSIALMNLLPLLPLDGGHIVFAIIEGIRGRFVPREVYEKVSFVGIGLVVLLFFMGLSNDLGNL